MTPHRPSVAPPDQRLLLSLDAVTLIADLNLFKKGQVLNWVSVDKSKALQSPAPFAHAQL